MRAVCLVRVIVNAAGAIIEKVCGHNETHGRDQQPGLIMYKKQLEHQQQDTRGKQEEGYKAMMMLYEPVVE